MSTSNRLRRTAKHLAHHGSLAGLALALAACFNFGGSGNNGNDSGGCNGGLHDDVAQPGDQPGGVELALGEIAVAPDGRYLLFKREDGLAIGWTDTGMVADLPVAGPDRLAFSKQRDVAYVTTRAGDLHAIDVDSRTTLWSTESSTWFGTGSLVVSSADDTRVVVGQGSSLFVIDAQSGELVGHVTIAGGIVDVEILPDDERALVVEQHSFDGETPSTRLAFVSLLDGELGEELEVPNCADDIQIHGDVALLAPTTCNKDPISVVSVAPGRHTERFRRNLPGFGPVAISPDGALAVGFFDRLSADASLFDDPAQIPGEDTVRFHLMVLDPESLGFELHPYGDSLPRYALTPDGQVLLVDHDLVGTTELFDLQSRTYRPLTGPQIEFEKMVLQSDSKHAWVLSGGSQAEPNSFETAFDLFDVDLVAAETRAVTPGFRPLNLNISPDDARLFLRKNEAEICVFEIATGRCEVSFSVAVR